jgi:hypothetical protein
MLALQLAQTLKAQADGSNGMTLLPYALEKAFRVAPEAFAGQMPTAVLATFEQGFPQAVEDVLTGRIVAQIQAGLIPHLTVQDMQTVLRRVFGTEALDDHIKLFVPMIVRRIRETFDLYLYDVWVNGIGDVWVLQRPTSKDADASLTRMCESLEAGLMAGITTRIQPLFWTNDLGRVHAEPDPVQKALLAYDLFRDISAFACPLEARDVLESRLTFDDMINGGLAREYIRESVSGWINGLAHDAPLHSFQTHTFSIPAHLQAAFATLEKFGDGARKAFYASLNTELEVMLGVHASVRVDSGNTLLFVRLYLPAHPFQNTRPFQQVAGRLTSKLREVKALQEKTTRDLRLEDLEGLLTEKEKDAVGAAIESLKISVLSDKPTQGAPLAIEHMGHTRSILTKEGVLVPLALGRIVREVILLKTGLQCITDARDNLISEVLPARDPNLSVTKAGKALIAQQDAVLKDV